MNRLFPLSLLALSACAVAPGLEGPPVAIADPAAVPHATYPAEVPFQRLAEPGATSFKYNSGLTDPANIVVHNEGQWRALWDRISAPSGPPKPAPSVDFNRQMLLVAAMGTRPTGGYTIRIERVEDLGPELVAHVLRTSLGPRCGATAALTEPVDIAVIGRSAKPVRWSLRDELSHCP
jgi:hypothetical protein